MGNKGKILEEIKSIENRISELKKELNKPEEDDFYWYVGENGLIISKTWAGHNFDMFRFNTNNCFKDVEQAQAKLERTKTEIELRKYIEEHELEAVDWTNVNQVKYYLFFDCRKKCVNTNLTFAVQNANTIYCTSDAVLQNAIEKIGRDRLEKYLKGE